VKTTFNEAEANEALSKGLPKATVTLKDEQKTKQLVEDLEKKVRNSKFNESLQVIPLLVSCLKSYVKREYTEIPMGSILAIVSALIYWLSPIDIIPDYIPGFGYIDDAAVVLVCLKMVQVDLDEYQKWLENRDNTPT
jgi:uncharacterized membrane protein YkvA (DUF1232 family)